MDVAEEIDLNAEEEAALDAAWGSLPPGGPGQMTAAAVLAAVEAGADPEIFEHLADIAGEPEDEGEPPISREHADRLRGRLLADARGRVGSGEKRAKGYDPNEARDEGGKWTSGGAASSGEDKPGVAGDSPEHEQKAQAKLDQFKERLSAISNAPVVRHVKAAAGVMRAAAAKFHQKLVDRYGQKAAATIMAAGVAADLAVTGGSALAGIPVYVPGLSILGSLPAVAVAEVCLQARRAVGKSEEGMTGEEALQAFQADVWEPLTAEFDRWVNDNRAELSEAFQAAKDEGVPGRADAGKLEQRAKDARGET